VEVYNRSFLAFVGPIDDFDGISLRDRVSFRVQTPYTPAFEDVIYSVSFLPLMSWSRMLRTSLYESRMLRQSRSTLRMMPMFLLLLYTTRSLALYFDRSALFSALPSPPICTSLAKTSIYRTLDTGLTYLVPSRLRINVHLVRLHVRDESVFSFVVTVDDADVVAVLEVFLDVADGEL
jgi:hypothetical protein